MATTAIIDLKHFTPPIIKNQELWGDFLDVVSDELDNVRIEIELKNRLFEVDLYTDVQELLQLSRSLGYSPNLILTEDIDYVRQEVASIVFKIKNKAIYSYYNYLFKLVPRLGAIFILFHDYLHLARAIDYDTTYTNLSVHDWSLPFTGLTSILHYDEYNDDPVSLDYVPTFDLDSDIPWYLDQDIVTKPTQHLALEYIIDSLIQNEAEENVLITDKYLKYLSTGVHYGRKVSVVPHIGFNISFMMDELGFFDTFSGDTDYSIPLLETICAVTDGYRTIDNVPSIVVRNNIEESFKYLAVGIGTKSFIATANLALMTDLNLFISFEDKDTDTFKDNISTLYTAIATGTYELQDSISGKAVYYNGVDTVLTIDNYASVQQDTEINFWIQGNTQVDTDPRFLYQSGFLDIFYNTANESIDIVLIGSSTTSIIQATGITSSLLAATDYNLSIIINETSSELKFYLNNVLIDTNDISGIGTFDSINDLLIGSNLTTYFKGKIDELRIYNKILLIADRTYLYTNKIGTLNYLSNEVYRQEISTNQVNEEDSSYWMGEGSYPSNHVTDEILALGDDSFTTLAGTLKYPNLAIGSLVIDYYSFPSFYTVTSDKEGSIVGEAIVGTIDYETGEYNLTFSKDHFIFKEIITDLSVPSINYTTDNINLKPESIGINYSISGTNYKMVTDIDDLDGTGHFLVANGITSSIITYATGNIVVAFSPDTDVDEIYISYFYVKESSPTSDINVVAKYVVESDLEITEAGLLNEDGIVTAYATFPKSEVEGVFNHLSTQFFIEK